MLIPLLDIYESLTEPFCSPCVSNAVRCVSLWIVEFVVPAMAEIFYCEFVDEKINAALKFLGN